MQLQAGKLLNHEHEVPLMVKSYAVMQMFGHQLRLGAPCSQVCNVNQLNSEHNVELEPVVQKV